MKLNQTIVKVIDADTAVGLTIAVNTFIQSVGEDTLLEMHFSTAGGARPSDSDLVLKYSCMIVYTH
jgi:hypothetical protein